MSRRASGAAAVAAVAMLGLGGAASAQEAEPAAIELTSVDTAGFPSVTAVVTVDPGVAGVALPAEAFEVLEDGEPVAAQVARMPTSNLELVLALDTSGSMEGEPLAAAQQAATDFLTALPADVPVAVVGFGPEPALLAATSTDRAVQADTLAGLTASGETALYDAVIHATQQFSTPATDRVVVLLSDGGDTSSAAALEAAEAAAAGVTLYVIDLVTPESNPDALARLAAAGQGTVSSAVDPTALDGLYQAAARALVNRYQVDYTSDATGTVDLSVRLTTEGGTVSATQPVQMPVSPTAPTDPPAGEAAAKAGSPGPAPERSGPHRGLLVGAVAMFLALLTIGLVVVPPRDTPPRPVTNLLPVPAPPPERPTPSQLTQRVTDATEAFLERRGRQQGLAAALDVAGISLRTGELVVLVVVVTVIGALAGLAVAGLLGFLLAAGIPLVAWAIVNVLADRRRERFADLLPDNLQLLTSSLRSGHSLLHALDTLAREAPEPARAEFRRVLLETRVGRDPGDALSAVADRMGSDDFTWVVGAIEINREVGGDLPATIDSVADTIRERQRVHRQIKALTAEGRISGYVLTGLPPVLALVMAAVNPGYFSRLASGGGLALLLVGAALLVIGWIWMRRLGRLDF